jgi:hypothetical protein
MAVLLGLVLGSCGSGVWTLFLWLTRSYRRARNFLVIGIGYIVVVVSSLSSLAILLRVLERMDVGRDTPQDSGALYAYIASFACVAALAVWSEFKWRNPAKS